MESTKPKLIIIEAPQGGGKTTLTNMLRDGITSSILLRLSGTPKPSMSDSYDYHKAYLKTIHDIGYIGLHHILDRSYISEQVFARLGYKDYNFDEYAFNLHEEVESMSDVYDIHYILLMADEDTYIERLKRDKPQYSVAKFSAENSIRQLNGYKKCFKELERFLGVNVHYLDNSKLTQLETYKEVLQLVGLSGKE